MNGEPKSSTAPKNIWLIYIALIAAAIMLLGDGLDIRILARLTTRLGGSVLLSALFLIIGKNRPSGIIATAIIWIAFIITLFN
jgi:hypothetical protein